MRGNANLRRVRLWGVFMSAFQAKLERFECLAQECEEIARKLEGSDRDLYQRASQHYRELAGDIRALIASFDLAA